MSRNVWSVVCEVWALAEGPGGAVASSVSVM